PANIASGDLLLVFFSSDGASTITFPEGWTQLFQTENGTYVTFGAWYRIADGEEGATITVTTSTSEMTAHTSYRIIGYSGTPEIGTATTGINGFSDPPSLTPTWGALDTLWLAIEGHDYHQDVLDYPVNYTDGRCDYASSNGGCGVATARRELNAISEDPSSFYMSADQWVANTVAIKPEEGVPPAYYHGLKVQGVGELALCDAGVNPLRIRKGGVTYGVELVETSDPNASKIRIKTPAGIKAIRKYT
ncbi:unnamed protein product, partial [marine sediment metagenome]